MPALSVEQHKEVVKTLKECAEEADTTVAFVGKDVDFSYRFESSRELGPHTRVCLSTKQNRFDHLAVPLPGEHQAHNCGLALAMLDRLKEHGFSMEEQQVFKGLQDTRIHGRMEKVWDTPRVYIDGAHNGASIEALIKSLGAHVKYDSLVMIFGCNDDKDVPAMLREVGLGADKVLFTKSRGNVRAAEPTSLERRFEELSGKMAQVCDSLEDALKVAHRAVGREDLIVICGSFYLAGEARKYFLEAKEAGREAAGLDAVAWHPPEVVKELDAAWEAATSGPPGPPLGMLGGSAGGSTGCGFTRSRGRSGGRRRRRSSGHASNASTRSPTR